MNAPLKTLFRETRSGQILILGLPLLAGRLSHYFHQIADSMMMGHYRGGSTDLGALAIAGTFVWIVNTMLWPLGTGIQAIVSRKSGKDSSPEGNRLIGQVLDNGVIAALLVGCLAVLVSFTARPCLSLLIRNRELSELALQYIRILRFSLPLFGIQQVIMRFFSSLKWTRYSMISSLLSNLVNIFLNYLFIFGKLGFPEMGIRGAALGTMLSYVAGFLYLLAVALKKEHRKTYGYFRFAGINPVQIRNIIRLSLPPAIQNMVAFAVIFLYEAMVENLSLVSLAATHVVFAAFRINKTIVGGFSHGTSILAGHCLGAGDRKGAERFLMAGYRIGAAIGVLVLGGVFFFPGLIARGFSGDPATLAEIARALRFFAPFYFVEILGFTFEMVFTNNGWGRFVLYSEMATNLVFILGFTFLFARVLQGGVLAAWLGFGLYQIFHSLILHLGWRSGRWLHISVD